MYSKGYYTVLEKRRTGELDYNRITTTMSLDSEYCCFFQNTKTIYKNEVNCLYIKNCTNFVFSKGNTHF